MARQPRDVDVGDGLAHARSAQAAGENAQLVEVGDDAASAPFLQAKEDLGLHRRTQSPHDHRMTARDRGGRPAPGVEIGRQAFAVLIPPQCVVRSAQPAQVPCLPVANRDAASPNPGSGWAADRHELRGRKIQTFPVIVVNLAQRDAVVTTRAGTVANRADDLTPPKLAHRPRGGELLDRHPGKLVSLAAGHAEPVRRPRFGSASLHTARPKPQQRVIRLWCQRFGFRVPPCGGEKLRGQARPGSSGALGGRQSLTAANTALTGHRRSPAPTPRHDRRRRAISAGTDAGRSVSSQPARGQAVPEPRPTRLQRPRRSRRIRVAAGADAPSETSLLAATTRQQLVDRTRPHRCPQWPVEQVDQHKIAVPSLSTPIALEHVRVIREHHQIINRNRTGSARLRPRAVRVRPAPHMQMRSGHRAAQTRRISDEIHVLAS